MSNNVGQISAMPTKQFFVDMLVRDIPLERAVLDLVDNCIDGAKRMRDPGPLNYEGLWIKIDIDADKFTITDNCGGFDIATAREYAFRFGRDRKATQTPYSIGQFGVGMKRALFKFGRQFTIESTTENEHWNVDVDVDAWEDTPDWHFDFKEARQGENNPADQCGTSIAVTRLRPEVSSRFGTQYFKNIVGELIRVHQRQFIANGLEIRLSGIALTATDLNLLTGSVTPSVENYSEEIDGVVINVRIVAGVGGSIPSISGWYVVCNGRVVLAADRSIETGWARATDSGNEIPKFHNQFARFRGVVYFDCSSAEKLPWNTTKTGIDADSPIWQRALQKMTDHARIVIDFLNDLDAETSSQGREGPLAKALASATFVQADKIQQPTQFTAPDVEKFSGPTMKRISYTKPEDQLVELMTRLGLGSAKAVGEYTFDIAFLNKKN